MTYPFKPAVQLYSIREQLANNAEQTLSTLKNAGYGAVEGFDLIQLQQIKPMLDDLGFELKSSFLFWINVSQNHQLAHDINYPWIPEKWGVEYEIERAQKLGLDTLVMGYLLPQERQSLDQFKRIVDQLAAAAELCQEADLQLLYHNHAFEFQAIDGTVPYFYTLEALKHSPMGFELDVFWAQVAGQNPVGLMQQMGGQLKQVHLKTGVHGQTAEYDDKALSEAAQSYPLGTGSVDIVAVVKQAQAMQLTRAYVEQEYSQASIIEDLIQSLAYLKGL